MVVARQDHLTPAHLAIDAYERAREPKRLVILPGGHFDAYVDGFDEASAPAVRLVRGAPRGEPLMGAKLQDKVAVVTGASSGFGAPSPRPAPPKARRSS
jgi:fermentation-respiration switch protein FrsA (DUF1100 family)